MAQSCWAVLLSLFALFGQLGSNAMEYRLLQSSSTNSDGGVLCNFYNGVTNKAPLTNWCVGSAPYSPCSTGSGAWVGVTCGTVGGVQRVTSLSLASPSCGGSMASLGGGSVPASIGGLGALTYLQLCGVSLGGSLPSSLGGLTGLTWLRFAANSLGGSLPSFLWTMTGLQTLDLGANKFTGSLSSSVGGLTGLTWLGVYRNSLGGSLPSSLGQLTKLQYLLLDWNKFTASVPASFCSLPRSMTDLAIDSNPSLTCIPSCLTTANYPKLRKDASLTAVCDTAQGDGGVLCDFYNGVTNKAPLTNWCVGSAPYSPCSTGSGAWVGVTCGTVGGVQRVTSLHLVGPGFGGASNIASLGGGSVPASIGGLGALTYLTLTGMSLGGSLPSSLWTLTRLQYLDLGINKLTGTLSSSLGQLTGLTHLTVDSNPLGGSLPSSLWTLTGLQYLNLPGNKLTSTLSSSVAHEAAVSVPGQEQLHRFVPASFCSLPRSMSVLWIYSNPGLTCIPSCLTTANYPGLNKDASLTVVCSPASLPAIYYPAQSYPSGFALIQGELLGYVSLPAQYTLSFDLLPTADGGSVWRSIIDLTAGGGGFNACSGAGCRLPAIQFCNSGDALSCGSSMSLFVSLVSSGSGWSNQVQLKNGAPLPLNAWTTVSVDSVGLQLTLSTTGAVTNPTQSVSFPTPQQQTWPSVQVYSSDPWYAAASANIRNLVITAMTAAPSPPPSAGPTMKSDTPTPFPTAQPTMPTPLPTALPSPSPTMKSDTPTPFPTAQPTMPTPLPTALPSPEPTIQPSALPTALPESLAIYLPFDGNVVGQVSGHAAKVVGTLSYAASNRGQAVYFNNQNPSTTFPANYVLVPNTAGWGPMTVSFWMKPDSVSYQTVVALGAANQPAYGSTGEFLQIDFGPSLVVAVAVPSSNPWGVHLNTGLAITANVWSWVVVTVSETFEVTVYLNGIKAGQKTGSGAPDSSRCYQWIIGGSADGRSYQGWVDDFKVYNYVLVPPFFSNLLPVSYYPSASYPNGFTLAAGNLVGVASLPEQYALSFDLMPTADGTGWRGIVLLIASGADMNSIGGRLPWVAFSHSDVGPTMGLSVFHYASSTEADSKGTDYTSPTPNLPLNDWSTVAITTDSVNLLLSLTVTGAITIPTQFKTFTSPAQLTWPSVQIYASDPWSLVAAAKIRNLAITAITAAPTPQPSALPSPPPSADPTMKSDTPTPFPTAQPTMPTPLPTALPSPSPTMKSDTPTPFPTAAPSPSPTFNLLAPTSVGQVINVGTAANPAFNYPNAVTVDNTYLYVADTKNNLIRRVDLVSGAVTSVGTTASPPFNSPEGISVDGVGKLLYVADRHNNLIRRLDLTTGQVTSVGTSAIPAFDNPVGVCVDSAGKYLYVGDTYNNLVRRVDLTSGQVTNLGTSATFSTLTGVSVDGLGRSLYVADWGSNLIRKIDLASGAVTSVGTSASPAFSHPNGVAVTGDDKFVYVADTFNNLVRRIDLTTGLVSSLGISASPGFSTPCGVSIDSSGQFLYIADPGNNLVRRITLSLPSPSALPTTIPTPEPTAPSAIPSNRPSVEPTYASPTPLPSPLPSFAPSAKPSARPSAEPTQPTARPTALPTFALGAPTPQPSLAPSPNPSQQPSTAPSPAPSAAPTTAKPSPSPSPAPSVAPTAFPSNAPTPVPSFLPSAWPSALPTQPTAYPTARPTAPTPEPTQKPSVEPTKLPTPLPTAEPTAKPTTHPSAQPTPQPTADPTTMPSPQPSAMPTTKPSPVPSTRPTPAPSANPTPAPSARPTPRPSNSPTGQPSSRPSSRPTLKPTKHCGPGTFIGSRGLECLSCLPGTFSDVFGAESCSPCKPGSFSSAGSPKCNLCPKTSYQPDLGAAGCIVCPAGRLTPFDGATTDSACLSPLNNFILGSFALGVAALLVCLYVIYGRFRFTSFIRRERVVMQQVKEYKRVMFELISFENTIMYKQGERKVNETIKRVFSKTQQGWGAFYVAAKDIVGILVFVFLCITLGTIAVVLCFAFIIMRIFFNSLIIWKQSNSFLNLVDYRSAILQVADALSELFADWHFPAIVVQMVRTLLMLLEKLFDFLARFKIDLSAMNVTCQGSKDPFILLENLFVLGCVIIVIESQMQVFRGLVFTTTLEKHNSILLSREYRKYMLSRQKEDATIFDQVKSFVSYALELLQLLVVQVLAQILDFKTVLQFAVAQVEFSAFVSSPSHTMASTEACNQVPGAKNFDYFLATVTSGLAFAVVLPTIYEVAKVCCPNDPAAMRKALQKQKQQQQQSEAEEQQAVVTKKSRPAPLNFWSYLRMPLTFVAPDLLLAHFTYGLVWLLKNSIGANHEDNGQEKGAADKSRRKSAAVIFNAENPMMNSHHPEQDNKLSFVDDLDTNRAESTPQKCLARLQLFYAYMLRTLHPFRAKSAEADRWREMLDKDRLPSYWDLLRIEARALFGTKEPELREKRSAGYWVSVFAACFLAVVPVGHLTFPGRNAAIKVANRFFYFFFALFGRWNEVVVLAYGIDSQVERMAVDSMVLDSQDRNRANLRYSQVIDATIAPRAILLQLFPWLTIWSVFSIATSRSAMWATRDSGLLGKKISGKAKKKKKNKKNQSDDEASQTEKAEPSAEEGEQQPQRDVSADEEAKVFPWLIGFNDAFERAKHEDNGRWKKRRWITYISALRIIILYSRATQYLVSSYMTFVSVWLLFHPANKAVLASIVLVLLPLAIAQGLGLVLVIGKALNVKDLQDVGNPGETEKKAIEFKKDGKSKEEVRALLVAKLEEKKRKLRALTAAEVEDEFDPLNGAAASKDETDEDGDDEEEQGVCCFNSATHARKQRKRENNQVEMTTRRHRPHQSIAEAILPARSSVIPRDSIGPEMAPSRLSFDGVEPPHRPSILARSTHNAHVLQAHGHVNALHQQHSSPVPNPNPNPNPIPGPGAGQHIRIQRPFLGEGTTHDQHLHLPSRPTSAATWAASNSRRHEPPRSPPRHSSSTTAQPPAELLAAAFKPRGPSASRTANSAPRPKYWYYWQGSFARGRSHHAPNSQTQV